MIIPPAMDRVLRRFAATPHLRDRTQEIEVHGTWKGPVLSLRYPSEWWGNVDTVPDELIREVEAALEADPEGDEFYVCESRYVRAHGFYTIDLRAQISEAPV